MAEQDKCVGETLRGYNDTMRELECLKMSARSLASQLRKVAKALEDAASGEHPVGFESRDWHPEGHDLVSRISRKQVQMLHLAKSLKRLGVPSSLPDAD